MVQARKQQQQLSRELANGRRAEAGGATDKAWRDGKRAEQAETSELLRAMLLSRGERTPDGRPTTGRCPALYPHWRHFVPRYIPLNQWSLRRLLGLRSSGAICNPRDTIRGVYPVEVRPPSYLAGGAEAILATDKLRNEELKAAGELMREVREAAAAAASGGKAPRKRPAKGGPTTSKARRENVAAAQGPTMQPPKKRTPPRAAHVRADEARRVLHAVFDLSELHQPHLIRGSAMTDGYGIYFHIHRSGRTQPDELLAPALKAAADAAAAGEPPAAPPRRGQPPTGRFYSVDELKAWGLTLKDLHFLGVDPGKRDLAHVAWSCIHCRATAAGRRQELAAPRYARERDEASKTTAGQRARDAVDALARTNSTSVDLQTYHGHASSRVGTLAVTLGFYAQAMFRDHSRKTRFKMQRWENRLVAAIRTMAREADPTGEKVAVLAYGSWGATAGRAGSPVNGCLPPHAGRGPDADAGAALCRGGDP
jgi:hypothetical protein